MALWGGRVFNGAGEAMTPQRPRLEGIERGADDVPWLRYAVERAGADFIA
jgi:hypothetical protein